MSKETTNPWNTARFISRLFYWYIVPLLKKGQNGKLEEADIYNCPTDDLAEKLSSQLKREWQKELSSDKPSLVLAAVRCFWKTYMRVILGISFACCVCMILQQICLGLMLEHFSHKRPESLLYLCFYTAGMIFTSWIYSVVRCINSFNGARLGVRVRVATSALIYDKALKLSQASLGDTTLGQIVNLLTNDATRFDQAATQIVYVLVGPLQMVIVTVILWPHIGYASVVGALVILLYTVCLGMLGRLFAKLRQKTAVLTDERIRLMNEIICGMRVIKMYAWETPFIKMVDSIRKRELLKIRQSLFLQAFNSSVANISSNVNLLIIFSVFALAIGGILTPEKAFLTYGLYNTLRGAIVFYFPMGISRGAEALVSFRRVQKFLLLDEKPRLVIETPKLSECGIWLSNVVAAWNTKTEPVLKSISFDVQPGELLAVVGQVGCGKSSLLMSILGELPLQSGSCVRRGRLAYASQEAWVFGGTLRENILLGKTLRQDKYQEVLAACDLNKDILSFPNGDLSLVGEKGVILSGGQKARVNLARCLYLDADIYLLDDPLSAVDSSVAKHLFDKCINGILKDKVKILVTHQIQFLREATRILILKEGECAFLGTFDKLIFSGVDFMTLLNVEPKEDQSVSRNVKETKNSDSKDLPNNVSQAKTARDLEETKQSGSVKSKVYLEYIRAGTNLFVAFFLLIFFHLGSYVLSIVSEFWLAKWTNSEQLKYTVRNCWHEDESLSTKGLNSSNYTSHERHFFSNMSYLCFQTNINFTSLSIDEMEHQTDTSHYLLWYTVLVMCSFLMSYANYNLHYIASMRCSRSLHNSMFQSLLRTSVAFFDNNPAGRILNRFSKDVGIVDEAIPQVGIFLLFTFITSAAYIVCTIIVQPILVIPAALVSAISYRLASFYTPGARDIKRYEAIARSPIFTHLSNSLHGLVTVRAFRAEASFQDMFDARLNRHTSTFLAYLASAEWLSVCLDQLTVVYAVFVTIAMIILTRDPSYTSLAGLVIIFSLQLVGRVQTAMRQAALMGNEMTSVERVVEYSRLESEAAPLIDTQRPPKNWPYNGELIFKSVFLRYAPHLPYILKNINFKIKPEEKVGIVGRTGAGKSSLVTALFRMAEPEGEVFIDNLCTKHIGLQDLRKNMSIIPQDPVLFKGPIRKNLDPFQEHTDDELWKTLEEAHLKDCINSLDASVSEGGSNFSVGQKQLICLARAILRRNKIIVLDEATANVDHK